MPVSAIINAAASEVEDYTRVVTATVPDSEIAGAVAGDLVHLLAELLDNALRYSPPISQVRVSAVHTGNGGLVIEVSDIGLGMTESDLRVANTRLQSGGEVNPYTARHMGLFVVGRLAAQHGLVVRLRSTIAGEPNSGTTAGVYVPAELLGGAGAPDQFGEPEYAAPADAHAGIATALALDEDHVDEPSDYRARGRRSTSTATSEVPVALVAAAQSRRQRDLRHPGVAGAARPASQSPTSGPRTSGRTTRCRRRRPSTGRRASRGSSRGHAERRHAAAADRHVGVLRVPRAGRRHDGGVRRAAARTGTSRTNRPSRRARPRSSRGSPRPSPTAGSDDAIYQKMLSEWLVDPTELAKSDGSELGVGVGHGWSAAAAAEEAPVSEHTEEGLPVREPGARLVPGAAESAGGDGTTATAVLTGAPTATTR